LNDGFSQFLEKEKRGNGDLEDEGAALDAAADHGRMDLLNGALHDHRFTRSNRKIQRLAVCHVEVEGPGHATAAAGDGVDREGARLGEVDRLLPARMALTSH